MTTQTKDERIKQQIREAARGLFQKWGLQKTTMEDIAKAAEKGKSTLYYYFKSKEEIFAEIAGEEFDAIFEKAQAAMKRENTAEGRLRAYLLCTIDEIRRRATVYEIIFGEITRYETIISSLRKQRDEEQHLVLFGILTAGVASGEFSAFTATEIRRLATILLLTMKTLIFEYLMRNAFNEVTVLLDLTVSVFVHGLKK
jgi:AcrR family transcriptional regulator